MQQNEDYVLKVLQDVELVSRKQIEGARKHLNGQSNVVDLLIKNGIVILAGLILSTVTGTVTAIRDPFGNSYGYSTAKQANSANGFNPTFDLWSTASTVNASSSAYEAQWIKNW